VSRLSRIVIHGIRRYQLVGEREVAVVEALLDEAT
jgi:hypothetical protein